MKKFLAVASAAVLALSLAACSPLEGEVVNLGYKPDNSGYQYAYGVDPATGKGGYAYRYVSDPECYSVTVRTPADKIRSACINANDWANLKVGDTIVPKEKK